MKVDIHHDKYYTMYHRMVGSKTVIVHVGDSWTAGDGAINRTGYKIDEYLEKTNKCNYPHYLHHKLDQKYDFINMGQSGASNETAIDTFHAVHNKLDFYDDVIVIFGLTSPYRDMLLWEGHRYNLGLNRNFDLELTRYKLDDIADDFVKYLQFHTLIAMNQDDELHRTYMNIFNLQNYCELKQYKLLSFFAFSGVLLENIETPLFSQHYRNRIDYNKIITEYSGPSVNKTMTSFVDGYADSIGENLNTFLNPECRHFNSSGYEIMADEIYKHLNRLGYTK